MYEINLTAVLCSFVVSDAALRCKFASNVLAVQTGRGLTLSLRADHPLCGAPMEKFIATIGRWVGTAFTKMASGIIESSNSKMNTFTY